MCLVNSFCCCFSLRTGTHLISLLYMGLFSYCALFGNVHNDMLKWYIYGGLFSSICAWIGLRWEKKGLVYIMFLFDACIAVVRSLMIYGYYEHSRRKNDDTYNIFRIGIRTEDELQQQVFFLILQLYFIWVQFSYLREKTPPANVFLPVPQNVIVTEVRRENVPAPMAPAYPIEYQPQLPYSVQPYPFPININGPAPSAVPQYPAYPSNPPQLYPSTAYPNTENATMNAQLNAQPFPYDAPPPYSETKTAPSAPSF